MFDDVEKYLTKIFMYFRENGENFDFDKYKFVLTDEEIYVLKQIIKRVRIDSDIMDSYISFGSIAYDLYHEKKLVKKAVDKNTVIQLLFIAYRKIRYVDMYYGNEEQKKEIFKTETLLSIMGYSFYKSSVKSITMEEYDKLCKNGPLFTSTSRFQRFILKYRIGMFRTYKRQIYVNGTMPQFYEELSMMCKRLGYTDRDLSCKEIDDFLFQVNSDLVCVKEFLDKMQSMNDVNESLQKIKEELNVIDDHFYNNKKLENLNEILSEIKEKLNYVDDTLTAYNQNEAEKISAKSRKA